MGKRMARIDVNGVVINVEWCSVYQPESDILKDPSDRIVGIGDTYVDGKWYHDGAEVLTQYEQLQLEYDTVLIDYEYQLSALMPATMSLDLNEEQTGNKKLYEALNRVIERKQVDNLEEKLNVFLAAGKLTEDWYNELLNMIKEQE